MTIATLEPTIVLVGFESVGKSALFRHLTGQASGDEANFRGSTVQVRSSALADGTGRLIDTPGIRSQDDTLTTRLALAQTGVADTLVLVVRGTHAGQEIGTLLQALGSELVGRNAALVLTFGDRAAPALEPLRGRVAEQLGIPVVTVNARSMDDVQRNQVLSAIQQARPLSQPPLPPAVRTQPIELLLPAIPVVQPEKTWFEHRQVGPWLALLLIALLFVLPVYLAYRFADWAQPLVDGALITPLVERLSPLAVRAPLLFALLAGDY
ncbi:MAG TPA: FeoB small GTPase domain-containing protein, partial [Caldilineaceae bacterium]|nr:FeoB small GTPase domain-containing protein [Caldilineaceae bacterium]